jgi:hypothetical protein
MLKDDLKRHQIKIGRDKLIDFLRDEYLLVPKVKSIIRPPILGIGCVNIQI